MKRKTLLITMMIGLAIAIAWINKTPNNEKPGPSLWNTIQPATSYLINPLQIDFQIPKQNSKPRKPPLNSETLEIILLSMALALGITLSILSAMMLIMRTYIKNTLRLFSAVLKLLREIKKEIDTVDVDFKELTIGNQGDEKWKGCN